MSWLELPTVAADVSCKPPFSFYFDLVAAYWKTGPTAAQNLPLRRICTLARKQGASRLIVESALSRAEVKLDIDALDDAFGGGGAAEALVFSFMAGDTQAGEPLNPEKDVLLGQAIVINYRSPGSAIFSKSYVFEAILSPPALYRNGELSRQLLNNFVPCHGRFECDVSGKSFQINGVYYAQQNAVTHVCAHACLRMMLNTTLSRADAVSGQSINAFLKRAPSKAGLQIADVAKVITDVAGLTVDIVESSTVDNPTFSSLLVSAVESGHLALLMFTTGNGEDHVVAVCGYTRNSDEWHPQALPAYSGAPSAQYYPSSSWVDHFIIHDDNFGPYYSLSNRALLSEPKVQAIGLIIVRPSTPVLRSNGAETVAAMQLTNALPSFVHLAQNKWFDFIARAQHRYVLRTILMEREKYIDHLSHATGHDLTSATSADLANFNSLPDVFWMVEFSLPYLFTGNWSKLGEVLVLASAGIDINDAQASVLGFRFPGLILVRDRSQRLVDFPCSLVSHVSNFQTATHNHLW